MDSKAVINGKIVELSTEEKEGAKKFHESRQAFAWINGALVLNEKENDDRDHQHWLLEDYGITIEEFENLPRGYMIPGRIQLFKGSDFREMTFAEITGDDIIFLIKRCKSLYGDKPIRVCNGVQVGKVGDIWEPISVVFTVK